MIVIMLENENKELITSDPELEGIVPDPTMLFEQEAVPTPTGTFEKKADEDESKVNHIDANSIPLPSKRTDADAESQEEELTPDSVIDMITARDEDGHSPCVIVAAIQKLVNVTDDMTLETIPEENVIPVDDIQIEDCAVSMYSLDGAHVNVKLEFDSVKSAYLRELNDLLNRYRFAQQSMQENEESREGNTYVMFSLTFVPKNTKRYCACQATFPISYDRVLDDNDVNCSMALLFMAENIQCQAIDIPEEVETELVADALREAEQGTGGNIFDFED